MICLKNTKMFKMTITFINLQTPQISHLHQRYYVLRLGSVVPVRLGYVNEIAEQLNKMKNTIFYTKLIFLIP